MGKKKNKPKKTIVGNGNKDFNSIVKNLDIVQYMAVCNFIESEVKRKIKSTETQMEIISAALDRNITAAMILVTDFELEEINKIFKTAIELIEEDNKKINELKKEGEGDWMKAADKQIEKIRSRVMELIGENLNQKKVIETLVMEFPKLSKSMVTNAYKKVKEEMALVKEAEADQDAVRLYDAIYGAKSKNDKTETKVEEIETKVEKVEINRSAEKEESKESKFEILNKKVILDIKGELGVYHIEDNKLSVDDVIFNSPEDVEETYRKQIEHLTKCRNEALEIYKVAGAL